MMIEKDTKEEIASSVIPVILGNGATSCRLVWRLYLTLGTVSLRLGTHRRPTDLLRLPCLFRSAAKDNRLLLEQLCDLSDEFSDYLLLLIPTDEPSRNRLAEHRKLLETRFILSSPDEVFSHIPCLNCNERL